MSSLQEELTTRIKNEPEKLMNVVKNLLHLYKDVKVLRYKDTTQALLKLDRIINQIFLLRQISASDIPLEKYDIWIAHLDRIYQNCQKEKQDIQQSIDNIDDKYDETETTILTPWITDWNEPTLQEQHNLQLVRNITLPVLFPLVHTILPGSILVDGPVNSGKSYTLHKIKRYLEDKNCDISWSFCTGFQFPPDAQKILSEKKHKNTNTTKWSIYIVDKVHIKELEKWLKSSWFQSWDIHIKKQPNTLFIILTTGNCNKNLLKECRNYFSHYIHFENPSSKTLYNYFKKKINSHYNVQKLKKHSYINLPIINDLRSLALISDKLANNNMSCVDIDSGFQKALRLCSKLALQENVVYQVIPNVWIPKNSFNHNSNCDYKYSLVHSIEKDSIEWCSQVSNPRGKCQTKPKMFWNIQLFDSIRSGELDRIHCLYVDPDTTNADSAVLDVIGSFSVNVNIFPNFLGKGLAICYENLILLWISIQNYLYHANKKSVITKETKSHIDSLITPKDILNIPERVKNSWFSKDSNELMVTDSLKDSLEPFQILYVESVHHESNNTKFELACSHKKSSNLEEFKNGIPGNVNADDLKRVFDLLLNK